MRYIAEFKKAYPEAKVVGVHGALERMSDKEFKFDGAWGKDAEDTKYGFEDDVSGHSTTSTTISLNINQLSR